MFLVCYIWFYFVNWMCESGAKTALPPFMQGWDTTLRHLPLSPWQRTSVQVGKFACLPPPCPSIAILLSLQFHFTQDFQGFFGWNWDNLAEAWPSVSESDDDGDAVLCGGAGVVASSLRCLPPHFPITSFLTFLQEIYMYWAALKCSQGGNNDEVNGQDQVRYWPYTIIYSVWMACTLWVSVLCSNDLFIWHLGSVCYTSPDWLDSLSLSRR